MLMSSGCRALKAQASLGGGGMVAKSHSRVEVAEVTACREAET